MSKSNAIVGNWNVVFDQYRWVYTFFENRTISWRDIYNGKTGTGTWSETNAGIAIVWKKSETKETWKSPPDPVNQTGRIDASWGKGVLTATKDQSRFDGFTPEGQVDAFACWAACLSWYTRVLPDIATLSQTDIIGMSDPRSWAANGSISLNGLMTLSLRNVPLRRSRIGEGELAARIKARTFPMLIGFSSGPMGGHVNVIHGLDEKAGTVGVMEPWFPDPATNKAYQYEPLDMVFANKKTGDPFKFTGMNTRRSVTYYTSKPLNGQFVICYNAKYG